MRQYCSYDKNGSIGISLNAVNPDVTAILLRGRQPRYRANLYPQGLREMATNSYYSIIFNFLRDEVNFNFNFNFNFLGDGRWG